SAAFGSGVTTVTCQWELEEYTAHEWVSASDKITIENVDATADFPDGLVVEFWNDEPGNPNRTVRVVANAVFSTDTTVNFETGDPFKSIAFVEALMVPSAGIDNTLSEVAFGAFTPDMYQSGW